MNYILDHTVLYNSWTDFLFAIVLIVVIVFFVKKMKAMKSEEKELEKQISQNYSDLASAQEELPEDLKFKPVSSDHPAEK